MTSDDFMKELIKRGYSAKYEDVVTVLLDPDTEDPEKLKSIIREEIGWKNSFGIKYTSRPDWMDSPKDDRILPENALFRDNQLGNEKIAEKRAPKAPDRESTVPGSVQRKGKRASRKVREIPEIDRIPGQMSLFDFLQDTTGTVSC